MTPHEARNELKSYRKYIEIREQRSKRIEELRALLYRCPVSKYGTEIHTLNPYRMEEIIDKLAKVERQYVKAINISVEALAMIERKVEQLDGSHYKVLRKRYIEGRSYEQIAVDMHYVYEYVRQLENQGVEKYARVP